MINNEPIQLHIINWKKGAASALISIFIVLMGITLYMACFDNLMAYNTESRLQTMTDTSINSLAAYTIKVSEWKNNSAGGSTANTGDASSNRTNFFSYNAAEDYVEAYNKITADITTFQADALQLTLGNSDDDKWHVIYQGKTPYSDYHIQISANNSAQCLTANSQNTYAQLYKMFLGQKVKVAVNAKVVSTAFIVEASNDTIAFPENIKESCKNYMDLSDMPRNPDVYNGILRQFKILTLPRYTEEDQTVNKSWYFLRDFLQAYGSGSTGSSTTQLNSNYICELTDANKINDAIQWLQKGYPIYAYIDKYQGSVTINDTTSDVYFYHQYMILKPGNCTEDYVNVTYVYNKEMDATDKQNGAESCWASEPCNNKENIQMPWSFLSDHAQLYLITS